MKLSVVLTVLIGILVLACSSDIRDETPKTRDASKEKSEIINGNTNANSIAEESTVKITISTADDEYVNSGVIVGDGRFVVTYAPITVDSSHLSLIHI